jgi:hypothetical protein
VPVVIFLAAAAILGGVIVVAMGRGGEMARGRTRMPAHSDLRTWSDVADYRPPAALLGYHAAATEHALALIARTIAERDAEIDWLRQRLADVQPDTDPDVPHQIAGSGPAAGTAVAAAEPPAVQAGYSVQQAPYRQAGEGE